MKKTAIALLAAGIAFGSMAGTAMGATKLESTVGSLKGIDYRWGGTTTAGFDCSGFTMYVFGKFGIDLPHQSKAQAKMGFKVARDELRPGDLVFFNTNGKGISHVGIYMGNGDFAHSSSKYGVRISGLSDSYYNKRYVTARRILGGENYLKIATEAAKEAPKVAVETPNEQAPKQEAPQQEVAEQEAAEQAVSDQAPVESADSEPEVTEPEVTEPEVTEPEVAEPAADPVAYYTEQSELASEESQSASIIEALAVTLSDEKQ